MYQKFVIEVVAIFVISLKRALNLSFQIFSNAVKMTSYSSLSNKVYYGHSHNFVHYTDIRNNFTMNQRIGGKNASFVKKKQ